MQVPKEIYKFKNSMGPIIQVDDDQIIINLIRHFHKKAALPNEYQSFLGAKPFFNYLQELKVGNEPLPLLILLDINMPEKNGFEVLKEVRKDQALSTIPFFTMLSSSSDPEDMEKAMNLGANDYLIKPDNAKDYKNFFVEIKEIIHGTNNSTLNAS